MRALVKAQKRDEKSRKRKKEKERAKATAHELKELAKRQKKTMEWNRVKILYPKSENKQIILRNIHPDLRARFLAKCSSESATTAGKLRYLMKGCVDGTIDDAKVNEAMEGITSIKAFGPVPKSVPHRISIDWIPAQLRREFKSWCDLRGYTVQGKLKQLMICYLKGVVE